MSTEVTFIGSAAVLPEVGQESASFVLNGRYLVDCDPLAMEALLITHCHHDHVLGLPAFLFYRGMIGANKIAPLRIYGPAEEMPEAVENARRFLRAERFPEIWPELELHPLHPGDIVEEPAFTFRVERTIHGVPGLAYRWEDRGTGSVIAFTGDTAYKPEPLLRRRRRPRRPERPGEAAGAHPLSPQEWPRLAGSGASDLPQHPPGERRPELNFLMAHGPAAHGNCMNCY
jgi:hypothetical protein